MGPLLATLLCLALYAVGYFVYARFLAEKVFRLDPERATPSHTLEDGIDYVPTRPAVLFGHHFASITGLAPMLGPAVAVIWGWVPAMLWIVLGAILVGCVHDFSALVVSIRARGESIGKVAEGVIGHRAKFLFLALILFGIALAMGVFVFVIAELFKVGSDYVPGDIAAAKSSFPSAVLPSATIMVTAMVMGYLLYRRGFPLGRTTLVGFLVMLASVWLGTRYPTLGLDPAAWPGRTAWIWVLLGYGFLASVLPVWSLLQARDFLNSFLLYLGLLATYAGFLVLRPEFAAPALNPHPAGAPPLLPFVFIVIACGAASGFHALVSSGTTAKQLDRETHARFIGYGGMIGESLLGLIAVLACTAGFVSPEAWNATYQNWAAIEGSLGAKLGAFIRGCARFVGALGVDHSLGAGFIAVIVVSFALTTLDSATRLLRFNIAEIGNSLRIRILENRYVATALAVAAIGWFAFYKIDGKPAGVVLWILFGVTNQLLAGLTLLVVSLYLHQRGRNPLYTTIPAAFMLGSTLLALVEHLSEFAREGQVLLLVVGSALLLLAVGIIVESIRTARRGDRHESDLVPLGCDKNAAAGGVPPEGRNR